MTTPGIYLGIDISKATLEVATCRHRRPLEYPPQSVLSTARRTGKRQETRTHRLCQETDHSAQYHSHEGAHPAYRRQHNGRVGQHSGSPFQGIFGNRGNRAQTSRTRSAERREGILDGEHHFHDPEEALEGYLSDIRCWQTIVFRLDCNTATRWDTIAGHLSGVNRCSCAADGRGRHTRTRASTSRR
jgi:hypothetical protein